MNNLNKKFELLNAVVQLYNNERPHMSIGNLTPNLVHQKNINVSIIPLLPGPNNILVNDYVNML